MNFDVFPKAHTLLFAYNRRQLFVDTSWGTGSVDIISTMFNISHQPTIIQSALGLTNTGLESDSSTDPAKICLKVESFRNDVKIKVAVRGRLQRVIIFLIQIKSLWLI